MNLTGDLVRRAAANVSSTVSSVASAASGRKRHDSTGNGRTSSVDDSSFYNAKEKYSLTLKCTPNKDAVTTANLAVKTGFLLKRNEQGHWQKRFLCIVPHTFLYYFDNETAESPRGVIDLELYHHICRDENNALKLSISDDDHLRSFYFNDEDDENLNEWMSSLVRERFFAVCEERNAYQQMQTSLTGVIDNASNLQKESEREKEQLEERLQEAKQLNEQAEKVLQNILIELGVTDDEMTNLSDLHKIGNSLKEKIVEFRQVYEKKLEEINEQFVMQHAVHEKAVQEIYSKLEAEIRARKELETSVNQSKESVEKKYKEYEAQIDTVSCNFQMAITGKVAAESKNTTLSEQKKILVKEVKSLRKRCDDYQTSVDSLKTLNEKLLKVTQGLQQQQEIFQFQLLQMQQQLDIANAQIQAVKAQESNENSNGKEDEKQEKEAAFVQTADIEVKDPLLEKANIDDLVQYGEKLLSSIPNSANVGEDFSSGGDGHPNSTSKDASDNLTDRSIQPGGDDVRAGTPVNISRKTGINEEDVQLSRKSTNSGEGEDDRSSWDLPSPALRDLSWLSEEQSKIVQKRLDENASATVVSSNFSANGAVTMKDDSRSGQSDQSTSNNIQSSSSAASATFAAATQTASSLFSGVSKAVLGNTTSGSTNGTPSVERRGSYFSIFSKGHEDESGKQATLNTVATPAVVVPSTPEQPQRVKAQSVDDEGTGGVIMHCLRCNGTVRGPRLSTCKCSVPALTQEDLHSGTAMLSGFISKGSSVAGGLAGGFMKGVGGFMSTAANQSSTPSSANTLSTSTNSSTTATSVHTPTHNSGNASAAPSTPPDSVAL